MKPLKKHRLSITKRYFGRVIRGLMRLMPEKSAKANSEAIGSEYTIDLTAVCNFQCFILFVFTFIFNFKN